MQPQPSGPPEPQGVVPGIRPDTSLAGGPDMYGQAPATGPSIQFNTPWQRLGVSGYGQGNAAQGAYSEQTGQQGTPQIMQQAMLARTLPSAMPSPFGGISYGQPQPDPGIGNYGAASVPQGMSSRYARPQLMRTLY